MNPLASWLTPRRFKFLLGFAIVCRLIAAIGNLGWNHPDEWYQTVELASVIARDQGSWTEALSLHLRNLTWPMFLAGGMRALQILGIDSPFAIHTWVRWMTVALSLSVLWPLHWITANVLQSRSLRQWAILAVFAPYFWVVDASRPSQEHLSLIASLWALGFWVRAVGSPTAIASAFWSGFFAVLCGAFRYPSFLFALGLGIATLFAAKRGSLKTFVLGALLGAVAGGASDAFVYGRPWESFWFYLQYNIFTGTGAASYGVQGPEVYWRLFADHYGSVLLPLGAWLLMGSAGIKWSITQNSPQKDSRRALILMFAAYLIGHLFTPHKETRFMIPLEPYFVMAAIVGWEALILGEFGSRWSGKLILPKWLAALAIVLPITANAAFSLKGAWGDRYKTAWTFFEWPAQWAAHPETCAVISTVRPRGALLPKVDSSTLTWGFYPLSRSSARASLPAQNAQVPLIWLDRTPKCTESQTFLLHIPRIDSAWETQAQCTRLESQLEKTASTLGLRTHLKSDWISGPWYVCPSSSLKLFTLTEVREVTGRKFSHWEELPPYAISAQELDRLGRQHQSMGDGTFADW